MASHSRAQRLPCGLHRNFPHLRHRNLFNRLQVPVSEFRVDRRGREFRGQTPTVRVCCSANTFASCSLGFERVFHLYTASGNRADALGGVHDWRLGRVATPAERGGGGRDGGVSTAPTNQPRHAGTKKKKECSSSSRQEEELPLDGALVSMRFGSRKGVRTRTGEIIKERFRTLRFTLPQPIKPLPLLRVGNFHCPPPCASRPRERKRARSSRSRPRVPAPSHHRYQVHHRSFSR